MSKTLLVLLALASIACGSASRGPGDTDVKKQISEELTSEQGNYMGVTIVQTVTPQDITIRDRMLKDTDVIILATLELRYVTGSAVTTNTTMDCRFVFERFEKSWRLKEHVPLREQCHW